jgi:hypothetical protein
MFLLFFQFIKILFKNEIIDWLKIYVSCITINSLRSKIYFDFTNVLFLKISDELIILNSYNFNYTFNS